MLMSYKLSGATKGIPSPLRQHASLLEDIRLKITDSHSCSFVEKKEVMQE